MLNDEMMMKDFCHITSARRRKGFFQSRFLFSSIKLSEGKALFCCLL